MTTAERRGVLTSAEDTEGLGRALGEVIAAGDLLAIDGELGAGKTTLVRGLAAGAGCDPARVASPTFVLHRVYAGHRLTLHHIDCFRLGRGASLGELAVDELLESGAVAVEWAELAALDEHAPVQVRLDVIAERSRAVSLIDAPDRLVTAFLSYMART